jgi:hypothetical protein
MEYVRWRCALDVHGGDVVEWEELHHVFCLGRKGVNDCG